MASNDRGSYEKYLADTAHEVPRETKRRHRRLLDLDSEKISASIDTFITLNVPASIENP